MGQVEPVLGARHADVKETPLLLHRIRVIETAAVWQQPVVEADDKHCLELEPLGRVQREQRRRLRVVQVVHVRDQRNLFQKGQQRLVERQVRVLGGDGTELEHILPAILALLAPIAQVGAIARLLDHLVQQLDHAHLIAQRDPLAPHVVERGQRVPARSVDRHLASLRQVVQCVVRRDPAPRRPVDQPAHRLGSDLARRNVDDPRQAHRVVGVVDDAHVGHQVLDLAPRVKARRPDQLVGYPLGQERILQGTRLGVGAVHDRAFAGRDALVDQVLDRLRHPAPLLVFVVRLVRQDQRALVALGIELFRGALRVGRDRGVGHVEDGLRGAIVALEQHLLGLGIILFKPDDVIKVCAPERIDRLVVIAHGK